jgi:hypothetical protein
LAQIKKWQKLIPFPLATVAPLGISFMMIPAFLDSDQKFVKLGFMPNILFLGTKAYWQRNAVFYYYNVKSVMFYILLK